MSITRILFIYEEHNHDVQNHVINIDGYKIKKNSLYVKFKKI